MYLVSTYWGGALNVSDMRLVTTILNLRIEVDQIYRDSHYHAHNDFDKFLSHGFYRVYKIIPDAVGSPVLLKGKKLKELLDEA